MHKKVTLHTEAKQSFAPLAIQNEGLLLLAHETTNRKMKNPKTFFVSKTKTVKKNCKKIQNIRSELSAPLQIFTNTIEAYLQHIHRMTN